MLSVIAQTLAQNAPVNAPVNIEGLKTPEAILLLIQHDASITRQQLADALGKDLRTNRLQAESDQALRNNQECLKHNKEWQVHCAQLKAQIQQLQQQNQELQQQVKELNDDRAEWSRAFYSIGAAAAASAKVFENAPQELRDKLMLQYEAATNSFTGNGHIKVIPLDQITWTKRLGPSCGLYRNWWNDYQAKKAAAQAATNNSPNPNP